MGAEITCAQCMKVIWVEEGAEGVENGGGANQKRMFRTACGTPAVAAFQSGWF